MTFRMLCVFLVGVAAIPAQTTHNTDYQFRMPFHVQHVGKEKNIGLAEWLVFPNMTAPHNTLRFLAVGGVVYKQPRHWVEFMGGAIVPQNGKIDPLFNVRISDKSIRRIHVFTDLELLPRSRRFYSLTSVDVPLRFGNFRIKFRKRDVRGGGESENILFWNGWPPSWGVGPRIVLPVTKHVSLATAYQFRTDRNFLRNYLVWTF